MRVYQFRHVGTDTAEPAAANKTDASRENDAIEAITAQLKSAENTSGRVVPTEGLEPPHLAAHGPEPCASTNSATWALLLHFYSALPPTSAIILAFGVLRQTNFRYPRC